ncbi:hypothetical protein Tco_1357212 [Tanacetum coccineum]
MLKPFTGHLRGRSTPKKEILAVENLKAIVELEKNKSAPLEEKLKEIAVEQDDMKKSHFARIPFAQPITRTPFAQPTMQ